MDPLLALFGSALPPLGGAKNVDLFREAAENADAFDIRLRIDALARLPVLLIAATNDPAVPTDVHFAPLVCGLRALNPASTTDVVLCADHAFAGSRLALARTTLSWLHSLT